MKKCECMGWARTFEETLYSMHHPYCEKRNIEEEAKKHINNLIKALEYEGNMGDGISEEFYEKYIEAKFFIGQKII